MSEASSAEQSEAGLNQLTQAEFDGILGVVLGVVLIEACGEGSVVPKWFGG